MTTSTDSTVILRNLKGGMYKMNVHQITNTVISMTVVNDHIFVSIDGQGISIFRIEKSEIYFVRNIASGSCYDLLTSTQHLVYVKEDQLAQNKTMVTVCVHSLDHLLILPQNPETITEPLSVLKIQRKTPIALHSVLNFLILGGQAWMTSWTTMKTANKGDMKDLDESHVVIIELDSSKFLTHWKAANNVVSLLRTQTHETQNMLGVADTRTGLRVYDLSQRDGPEFVCLYHVPVEEIRNFELVGNDVAVFHKFESNISFWNMKEQRTILCINIQDQMKEMTEEYLEADDDCGLVTDDGDHVTSATSLPFNDDMIIVYGTMSGCIFGMSVSQRSKVFNIPCPLDEESIRKNVLSVAFLPTGKLVIAYEKYGIILMDFSFVDPPQRPPTRCQKRST